MFVLLAVLAAGLFAWIPGSVRAQGGGADGGGGIIIVDPPEFLPCPTLRAADVLAPGATHQDLRVYFPWWLNVDRGSLGDGDVIVAGPEGYLQRGELVGVVLSDEPLPSPLDGNPNGNPDGVVDIIQPGPIYVATYRIFPPDPIREWTAAQNGSYSVTLAEGQVLTVDGDALPPKLLGGFRVAIGDGGEPLPVQPVETLIHIGNQPGAGLFAGEVDPDYYYATVQLFFDGPHVDVEFLELVRERNAFIANVRAVQLPSPEVDGVPVVGPGGDPDRPNLLTLRTRIYRLGALAPGDFRFVVRVNGVREGLEEFVVADGPPADAEPPQAELHVRNVTMPSDRPQRLEVVYQDRSGVDVTTIGDGDLMVLSPCLFLDVEPPFPCDWEVQRARFVEVSADANDLGRVVAVYEIDPPAGGWTHEHNGFYPVVWSAGQVCDRLGNCNREARLGGFEVAIRPGGDLPIPARADLLVDASDPDLVAAEVHIDFAEPWMVVRQNIRRDGERIYLEAAAEPLAVIGLFPPPPPPSQDLRYEVGALRAGTYMAVFVMNGHVYGAREFRVERGDLPPIPAEVSVVVDASDPQQVSAVVTVQFERPHHLVQAGVVQDGQRLALNAEALPLPDRLDGAGDPAVPEPIELRYPLGALRAGSYLAVFVMNDHPYAATEFTIENPGPPIPARALIEIISDDPTAVVARVRVQFESPHLIEGRDLHRERNHFLMEATARPIRPAEDPNNPDRNVVVVEYPLGALGAGTYSAAFVMNGFAYTRTEFSVQGAGEFDADVALEVDASDPGNVQAQVTVLFADRYVIIENPGTPRVDGNTVVIDAQAVVATFVQEPEHLPIELSYNLGGFRPGEYVLVYKINGNAEARAVFRVEEETPIPAGVGLEVEVSGSAAVAHARIQFRDHYRITARRVTQDGSRFVIDLDVDGPLPILAPIPPPPVELSIPLADHLADGVYFAALRMNGFLYAADEFRVAADPMAVEVELAVEVGADGVTATSVVDFENPYVLVTDPGVPVRRGELIEIHATAEEVVFVQEPSGDPQRFNYDLGQLPPGRYGLVYVINGRPEAHARFAVEAAPEPPVAHIAGIEVAQGNASWFAEVGVILLPGQQVTDWGTVRQGQDEFHVDITVDWVDFPNPIDPRPIDPALVPEGVDLVDAAAGDALIGGSPVRIVRHSYVLGILDPGEKIFYVHSRGQTVARRGFIVPGSGPSAALRVEDITEASARPQRFTISYHDAGGLDHDSIRAARVAVTGPDGTEQLAVLEEYASTDDAPSTSGFGVYLVPAPGGEWDPRDNGRYCVQVDREAIRDLDGNFLESGRLGCFNVRILVTPPPSDTQVRVEVAMVEGEWFAAVEVIPARGTVIHVDDWGQVLHHGQTHLALATVRKELTPDGALAEPLAHRYPLGGLRPGLNVFVFKSNLGDCGIARFRVPGMEGDPIDAWRDAAGLRDGADDGADDGDLDENGIVAEYFFALDPTRPDRPRLHPEIVEDEQGGRHLALRYRRLLAADGVRQVIEVSRDLQRWVDADGITDVVGQIVDIDGTEELVVCLRERLDERGFQWMRIRLIRDAR